MNKKLKQLIVEKIITESMTVQDAVEYLWDLKEEDALGGSQE